METKEESLVYHLEALRSMLIRCFVALGIGLILMFFVAPYFMNWLIDIIVGEHDISLNFFSPMEVFILQIKMALVLDFFVCFPYIAKKLWEFIVPALYDHEKKFIKTIVVFSTILFLLGMAFCTFLVLPLIIEIGISYTTQNINAMFGISNIVSMALWLSICFGLMFQFPIITYFLIAFNIFDYEAVKNKRPYIFVLILIISAILTPTPDIFNQLLLAIPTYMLFEIGLFFSKKYKVVK